MGIAATLPHRKLKPDSLFCLVQQCDQHGGATNHQSKRKQTIPYVFHAIANGIINIYYDGEGDGNEKQSQQRKKNVPDIAHF